MAVLPHILAGSSAWKQVGGRSCTGGHHTHDISGAGSLDPLCQQGIG